MKKLKTCCECEHLKINEEYPHGALPHCGHPLSDHMVVPHYSAPAQAPAQKGDYKVIFWRIPEECKLSKSEVVKNPEPINEQQWEIKIINIM